MNRKDRLQPTVASIPSAVAGGVYLTVAWAQFPLTESELGDDTKGFPIVDQGSFRFFLDRNGLFWQCIQ